MKTNTNTAASAIKKDVYLTAAEFAADLTICLSDVQQESENVYVCTYTNAALTSRFRVRVHVVA